MAQSRPAADFKQAIGALDQAQSADGAKESINAPRAPQKPKQRSRRKNTAQEDEDSAKRRCVSSACVACRKRKSKCDGITPSCAACSQVYGTECIYDPNSDHRRKGVYKRDIDSLQTRNSTLQTLIQAILNWPEDEVPELVRDIRTCESLDDVAERIAAKENGEEAERDGEEEDVSLPRGEIAVAPTFESQLYGKMGDLRLDEGSVRYIGGTSNLIHLGEDESSAPEDEYLQQEDPITSWTNVTDNPELVLHLLNMYFTWHYTYFTTMSKTLFWRDFSLGRPPTTASRKTHYCTPLLVNAILALGCHFTSNPGARDDPDDSGTAGDHFFREAKRLIMENDEHEKPRLTTVQALALMSVREAGCGREARGWVYSGMSFRMACDMGLNLDSGKLTTNKHVNGDEAEEDVRRITFWGCFLFDKCWSNYLGRLPQLPLNMVTARKPEVFPDEDGTTWSPYTDSGFTQAHSQPARTRAVALQITKLCEISNDLMQYFYNPSDMSKSKGKQAELKKLSELHTRLETWRRELPKELEPKEGGLSSILVMHMFFQLLFIHLFRPFLKYTQATSPLPATVSPRKLCTQAAAMISKLLRLYKRSHGLRQICNIAVYIAHSACTIHLLQLPDKNARRDITHGVKHLEEIAEGWLCARRTLAILSALQRKWKVELPEEAAAVLARTDAKFGAFKGDMASPPAEQPRPSHSASNSGQAAAQQSMLNSIAASPAASYFPQNQVPLSTENSGSATGAGAVVRSPSDNNGSALSRLPPPQDANGLRAQQYPSAASTPQQQAHNRHRSNNSMHETRHAGTSPSEMFGGIEQLLRDSSDWAYRDQAQLATGFGNWGMPIDPDPMTNPAMPSAAVGANWATGGALPPSAGSSGGPASMSTNNGFGHVQSTNTSPVWSAAPPPANGLAYANAMMNGTTWMNGLTGNPNANPYDSMMSYDESEWYQ